MNAFISKLQNPKYVAKVQRFLGIIVIPPKHDRNGINGSVTHQNETSKKDKHAEKNCLTINGIKTKTRTRATESNEHEQSKRHSDAAPQQVEYIARYKTLHYLFLLASLLGDEPFYLLFYPLFGWNADFYVTRVTAMLWCVVMYLGQATKDVLCWPRPTYPPVVNLETKYIREYGMPSTHAMGGTAIPFTLLYFISSRYDISTWLLVGVAVTWSCLVCISRLYLGVHTVGDITIGVLYSALIMVVLLPWLSAFDLFQQTHPAAPFVLFIIAVLLCTKLYPKGKTTAKADSSKIVAIVYGMTVGQWLSYNIGIVTISAGSAIPYTIPNPTWNWAVLSIVRFVVGTGVVAGCKALLKYVTVPLVSRLMGRGRDGTKDENVLAIYGFITYSILGVVISHVVPILFYLLNIDREGFYSEGS